jgi:hypothetical protein
MFAKEGWVEMRGRRSRQGETVRSNCGGGVLNTYVACRESGEGRVDERMLIALHTGLE